MAILKFENVTKRFGQVEALKDFALDVGDKELLVLLGASGCGKSTALRLAAGLEQPDHGHVTLRGQPLQQLRPHDRDCALVFQNYSLYPQMTAMENILYPLRMRKVAVEEQSRRLNSVRELLHLSEAEMQRRPHALSGGQRQRVALGKALARQPGVLLLDEPFSSLDYNLRLSLRSELRRIQKHLGIAVLMVTHDQTDAAAIADRVAVMHQGKVQQVGAYKDLQHFPQTEFVAGFIGSPPMSLLPAEWDGQCLHMPTGDRLIPCDFAAPHGQVMLGLHPEDLEFDTQSNSSGTVCIHGIERHADKVLITAGIDGYRLMALSTEEFADTDTATLQIKRVAMAFDVTGKPVGPISTFQRV